MNVVILRTINETYRMPCVKRLARHGWVEDGAPTDLQHGPTNADVISTLLPVKLLQNLSPSRHLG